MILRHFKNKHQINLCVDFVSYFCIENLTRGKEYKVISCAFLHIIMDQPVVEN